MNRLPIRVALIAVLLPFAFAVAGIAVQLAWLPSLPHDVITHWGPNGADRRDPAWTVPLMLAVIGVVIPAAFGLVLAATARAAGMSWAQKLLAVASLFLVVVLSVVTTGSLFIQLPGETADIVPVVITAVVKAAVLAAGAWFVLPRSVNDEPVQDAAPAPVAVAPGERVAWVGHARYATTTLMVLIGVLALVTGLMVYLTVASGIWWLLIAPVVIAISVLGTSSWLVRVDDGGLTVRSALGWPQFRIPPADVESATVSHVVALGEFGGWGVRYAPNGRVGVVTRSGESLEVKRRGGRTLVVTVDDAGTAAGLLTTLSTRVPKG